MPIGERLSIQARNIERIENLKIEVKEKFPFRYYFGGRCLIFYEFIQERIDMSYRSIVFPANVVFSFVGPAINGLVQYFCFGAMLLLLFMYGTRLMQLDPIVLIIMFIPLFVAGMFSWVYGIADSRYLCNSYPFLLFGGIYAVNDIYRRSKIAGIFMITLGGVTALATGFYTLMYNIKW